MKADENCIFCKIVAGVIPCTRVYEDEKALAFMDISPLNKGHLLVIPKDHFGNIIDIDPELYGHLAATICRLSKAVKKALNPDGINILQLNGKAANQVVPHLHVHLVPRWYGDGLAISAWEPVAGNMEEISGIAAEIKKNL